MAFSSEQLQELNSIREQQNLTVDLFNKAIEENDYETMVEIAKFVISADDMQNKIFARGWQLHCLNWLTSHYFTHWKNAKDGSDEEESYLSELFDCLWQYKWIVSALPADIELSREDIATALEEMKNIYQDFSFSMAMIHKAAVEQAILMGDIETARTEFALWQKEVHSHEDDIMNDCEACEVNSLVEYYHFIGDFKKAIELAQPILQGEISCAEVPHITYYPVIDSLIQLGEVEKAKDYFNDAVEYIRRAGDHFLFLIPKIIQLAVRLNQYDYATSLLDEFNTSVFRAIQNSSFDSLQYLIALAPFNDEALANAKSLANEFDERNGNRYYQNQLDLMFVSQVLH